MVATFRKSSAVTSTGRIDSRSSRNGSMNTRTNPYHQDTTSRRQHWKRVGYSLAFGLTLLLLLETWLRRYHEDLHRREDSPDYYSHAKAESYEDALQRIPATDDAIHQQAYIEGTESFTGFGDEDDCIPGELDCNRIAPIIEDNRIDRDSDLNEEGDDQFTSSMNMNMTFEDAHSSEDDDFNYGNLSKNISNETMPSESFASSTSSDENDPLPRIHKPKAPGSTDSETSNESPGATNANIGSKSNSTSDDDGNQDDNDDFTDPRMNPSSGAAFEDELEVLEQDHALLLDSSSRSRSYSKSNKIIRKENDDLQADSEVSSSTTYGQDDERISETAGNSQNSPQSSSVSASISSIDDNESSTSPPLLRLRRLRKDTEEAATLK